MPKHVRLPDKSLSLHSHPDLYRPVCQPKTFLYRTPWVRTYTNEGIMPMFSSWGINKWEQFIIMSSAWPGSKWVSAPAYDLAKDDCLPFYKPPKLLMQFLKKKINNFVCVMQLGLTFNSWQTLISHSHCKHPISVLFQELYVD